MSLSRVRNDPSVNVSRGEGELLGKVLYLVSAASGGGCDTYCDRTSFWKGSVFAALMLMQAAVSVIVT